MTPSNRGYQWNTSASNNWESSSLKNTLNTEYYNNFGDYQKYVAESVWYLGSIGMDSTYKCEDFYIGERGNISGSSAPLSTIASIGLMYPSDYVYSFGRICQDDVFYGSTCYYENKNTWIYNGEDKYQEWMITPLQNSSTMAHLPATIRQF